MLPWFLRYFSLCMYFRIIRNFLTTSYNSHIEPLGVIGRRFKHMHTTKLPAYNCMWWLLKKSEWKLIINSLNIPLLKFWKVPSPPQLPKLFRAGRRRNCACRSRYWPLAAAGRCRCFHDGGLWAEWGRRCWRGFLLVNPIVWHKLYIQGVQKCLYEQV